MKVIHGIERDTNKVKVAPRKGKKPNKEVLNYIWGENSPRQKLGHTYMPSERDSIKKVEIIFGFNYP